MGKLTAKRIDVLRKPGRYGDGGTLFLVVERSPSRSKHWVQRLTIAGKRRDLGLGGYPFVGLAEARAAAFANRQLARRGGDPMAYVRQQSRLPTFRTACERVAAGATWKGHGPENRRRALERYCASIMDRRIDQIRRADVITILAPLMSEKPAAGARLHSWIRGALAWGVANEYAEYNVADGIAAALPNGRRKKPHASLPYAEVGTALDVIETSKANDVTKACIRFVVLTSVRSGEGRLAAWDEVDLDAREWRIPASRMKMGIEHRVPLSDAAFSVLEAMRPHRGRSGLVFPSERDKPLSPTTMISALHDAGINCTMHGFRSSFRVWAAEKSNATRDVAEMVLAHKVGSEIERSYARSDLFEKRRTLMHDWAAYLTGVGGFAPHDAHQDRR